MASAKKKSKKTQAALAALKHKRLDFLAWLAIVLFVATAALLEITLLKSFLHKVAWDFFFELNGVALSMFGALWTALGVRLSNQERDALTELTDNASVFAEEIIRSLKTASNFATFGAYCIVLGGIFLCIKIAIFPSAHCEASQESQTQTSPCKTSAAAG